MNSIETDETRLFGLYEDVRVCLDGIYVAKKQYVLEEVGEGRPS